jgi:hypothetical protein
MPNFKTHLTVSGVSAIAYTGVGLASGVPAFHCAIAGSFFCVAGLLPDIDSKSIACKETASLLSILLAITIINSLGLILPLEEILLLSAIVYFIGRMSMKYLIRPLTVHRGTLHTILVAMIWAEVVYLIASGSPNLRVYKAGGVFLSYIFHLLIDELWSIKWTPLQIKKSMGTAFKFFGNNLIANVVATITVIGLAIIVVFGS